MEVISIFTEVKMRKNMNTHKNELEKECRAGKNHTKPLVELLIPQMKKLRLAESVWFKTIH